MNGDSPAEVIRGMGFYPWGVWDGGKCIAGFKREEDAREYVQLINYKHNVTNQGFCPWCQKMPCECGKEVFR